MYFDNIANDELMKFPKPYVPNFSIKLSDVLHQTSGTYDNKLFKIEEIISDSIYRIYPIFNCKRIESTNSEDRIFDNHLIICKKEEKETYFTFISDENAEVQDYSSYGSYYSIGDSLTTAQYNSIVNLIRANMTISQDMHIQNSTVETDYGNYDFDFTGLILDNGIEVTDLTSLKCKLTNQQFRYSNYHLNLQVLRITNTNIEDDDSTDNKTIIPISVTLQNDTWVDIDTSDLEIGDIILYNCNLTITHDKPVIHYLKGLEVTSPTPIIESGDNAEIYAQLIDSYGYEHKEAGKTVYFFEKVEPSITLSATNNIIQSGDTTDIKAKVIDNDGSIAKNVKVHFFKETTEEEE